jgi:protein-L-isoaspartate O-methyltransferase
MKEVDTIQRLHLVERMEERLGHGLPSSIRYAFLTVPRHHFVPRYYKQEQPERWVVRESTMEAVYQDEPLITKVNISTMPCSSSSQPSVMASMLEALDLHPGQRVLERCGLI